LLPGHQSSAIRLHRKLLTSHEPNSGLRKAISGQMHVSQEPLQPT
jgi:hypothetical protein